MNRCPITYEPCGQSKYSETGLKKLSKKLGKMADLPFDAETLRQEAVIRSGKFSIQGVQPKLSARLNIKSGRFEIVDQNGRFILKPQTSYPELPQNEDLTMHLAKIVGIEVPLHGLIYAKDQSMVYFIQRFDRKGRTQRIQLEDFAQLAGANRDTKYSYSMERLAAIIDNYCTFPLIEKTKLFQRTIFNYLIGNEDMHLKNFSLITLDNIIRLAPAYDFVNSTIVLRNPEEIALPLNGKKSGLTRKILVQYFGQERLQIGEKMIAEILEVFQKSIPLWNEWVDHSFLSKDMKLKYKQVIQERSQKILLN